MKKFKLKKTFLITLVAMVGVGLNSAYADSPLTPGTGATDIVTELKQIAAEINALATAGANALSDAVYQFDQNFPVTIQLNSVNSTLGQNVNTAANAQTL